MLCKSYSNIKIELMNKVNAPSEAWRFLPRKKKEEGGQFSYCNIRVTVSAHPGGGCCVIQLCATLIA